MKKNLLYLLIVFCASLVAAQNVDYEDSTAAEQLEIIQENFEKFEYTFTEYTHEQSATRPTNVHVPSITRTASAYRSNNSNSPTNSGLKSDNNASRLTTALYYQCTNLVISGFSDAGTYFKSLCRLII